MRCLTSLFLFFVLPMSLFGKDPLEVGQTAPAMTVQIDNGESLDLASVYAEGPVLLYFYPKSFTPGCTKQACNLRDNFEAVRAAGITVLGVSADKVEKQADFREEYDLPFSLIADPEGDLGEAFGVGKKLGLVFNRRSFLIVDGKVAWRDLAASPGSQAEDAIAALKAVRGE